MRAAAALPVLAAFGALAAVRADAVVRAVPADVVIDAREASDATVDLQIVEGPVGRVRAAQTRESGDVSRVRTRISRRPDGSMLVAVTSPRRAGAAGAGDAPQVRVVVTVPRDAAVIARDENGTIEARGLGGDVDLRGANGGIAIARCTGTIVAITGNGGIELRDAVRRAQLETTNGGIAVRLSPVVPVPFLTARSTNGGIGVRVPRGFRARVLAATTLGEIDDPYAAAPGPARIRLTTTNGGITVGP